MVKNETANENIATNNDVIMRGWTIKEPMTWAEIVQDLQKSGKNISESVTISSEE